MASFPLPAARAGELPCRRVMGVDPGLASCGYGIVDFCKSRFTLIEYGVIETAADAPRSLRLLSIYKEFSRLLDLFSPREAGIETLYFAKNATSALAVAEARGVVSMCLAEHGIVASEYSPGTIKKTVSGIARADKGTVQEAVKLLLGLADIPRPDHAADALAAAITHIHSSELSI